MLVDGMVTGIFAGDPKRLSVKSAFPRLYALEADHGSLMRGAKGRSFGPPGRLTSFDEGLRVLVDTLVARLDVRLETPVRTVDDLLADGFDHVVCTVPATRAADLVTAELASQLRRIPAGRSTLAFERLDPGHREWQGV